MRENQKVFTIMFDSIDLGRLLDGLRIRAEAWRRTAEFIVSGYAQDDFICEECSDTDEAVRIAEHYEKLVARIERQIDDQGGW